MKRKFLKYPLFYHQAQPNWKLFFPVAACFILLTTPHDISANESFSVKKVPLPEESRSSSIDWYEFNAASLEGKSLDLKFVLTNHSNEEKKIIADTRSAYAQTNQLLDVIYPERPSNSTTGITNPDFIFERFTNDFNQEVILPAGSSTEVVIPTNVPDIQGELLGAVAFKEVKETEPTSDKNQNLQTSFLVDNEYVIAVHLLSDESVHKPFVFERARSFSNSTQFGVEFDVTNPNPNLESEPVVYSVKDAKGKVLFRNTEKTMFKMPPHTRTSYQISWSDVPVKVGKYTLTINGTKLPFEVKEEKVEKAKKDIVAKNVTIIEQQNNVLIWSIIAASVMVNIILAYVFFKRRRKF